MDPKQIQRILRQHLQTERLLGIDSVPVGRAKVQAIAAAAPAEAGARELEDVAPAVERAAADGTSPTLSAQPFFAAGEQARLDRPTKLRVLEAMEAGEVRTCGKCVLCKERTQTVFGEGDPDAEILFIGEGPGQTEDETGRPFVGAAGQLLDKMIAGMGFKREQVYIANVVKCRPPNNRAPLPPEVDACWDYLQRQIETIQPRVIVTLGGPATKMILRTERGITAVRGMWGRFDRLGPGGAVIPVMPTFHPAYLLRSYTHENRAKIWSDLKKVMAFLKEPRQA